MSFNGHIANVDIPTECVRLPKGRHIATLALLFQHIDVLIQKYPYMPMGVYIRTNQGGSHIEGQLMM